MMRSLTPATALALAAFVTIGAASAQATVNPTMTMTAIQAVINANPGGTVQFAPGTYYGNLTVPFDLVLTAQDFSNTVIDAQLAGGPVLTIAAGVTRAAIISGFTLRQGIGDPNQDGGGIYCADAGPIVRSCTIEQNVANRGGGVYVLRQLGANGRSLLMEDCIIRNNVVGNIGGGIFVTKDPNSSPGASATFVRCTVEGNTANDGGGIGVYNGARPVFDHCQVLANVATTSGGGVRWYEWSAPTFTSCVILQNVAVTGGGISYSETGPAVVEHTSVVGNIASGAPMSNGGGLFGGSDSNGAPLLANCLFADNYAANDGGAMWLGNTTPTMRFLTVSANVAGNLTGGIYFPQGSGFVLRNSIVWGNRHSGPVNSYTANLDGMVLPTLAPTIRFCDVEFGMQNPALFPTGAGGNIDANPLFTAGYSCIYAPANGYFLAQDPVQPGIANPCVDTASTMIWHPAIVGRCTRTDGRADGGAFADRGFHYPTPNCP